MRKEEAGNQFIMTVALICFFFLSLQLNNSSAAVKLLNGAAGADFLGKCGISFSGALKVFCRENCEKGNILIQTKEDTDKRDRYSIEYVQTYGSDLYVLSVKISNLRASDSGLYRCGLGDSWSSVFYQDFRLIVENADGFLTPRSDSVYLTSTPAETLNLNYSSGNLTLTVSSETTNQTFLSREESPTSQEMSAEILLGLTLTLTISGILLSGALLVICRKRCQKHPKGLKTRGSDQIDQLNAVYGNSSRGDLIYMNVKPVTRSNK